VAGVSENPRLRVSRLCPGGDRAYLDETKSKGSPCRKGYAVLVESRGQSDWISKRQAEECRGAICGFEPLELA
jgi:hypothetical protein